MSIPHAKPYEADDLVTVWKDSKAVHVRTVKATAHGIVELDDGSEWYANGMPTESRWARARIAHTLETDFHYIDKAKKIGRIKELVSFLLGMNRLHRVTDATLNTLERSIYGTVAESVRNSEYVRGQFGQNREEAINDVLNELRARIARAELVAVRGAADADLD